MFAAKIDELRVADGATKLGLPRLFDPRVDIWFDESDEGVHALDRMEDVFVAEDLVMVAFHEPHDPMGVFGKQALTTIFELSEEIGKIPNVRNVQSLTSSPWIRRGTIEGEEEGLLIGDFFERSPANASEEERLERMIAVLGGTRAAAIAGEERVRSIVGQDVALSAIAGNPQFVGTLVSEDARTAALMVQVLRPRVDKRTLDEVFPEESEKKNAASPIYASEAQEQVVIDLNALLAKHSEHYEFHTSGRPVLSWNFHVAGETDMQYIGVALLVIGILLLLILRRVLGSVLPLVVIILTIFGMLGIVWAKGDLLNNITAVAPLVMVAIATGDAVHLVSSYYNLRKSGQYDTRQDLLVAVLRRDGLAVFLTSLTTGIGFFSLMTSEVLPLRMFGYTAGIGAVVAYFLSVTVVPAVLSLLPPKPMRRKVAESQAREMVEPIWPTQISKFAIQQHRRVVVVTAFLFTVALVGLSQIRFSSDTAELFRDGHPARVDIQWLESHIGGTGDVDLVFYGPQNLAPMTAEELQQMDTLAVNRAQGSLSSSETEELAALEERRARVRRAQIATSWEFLHALDAFEKRLREECDNEDSRLHVVTNIESPLDILRKLHDVQAGEYRLPGAQDITSSARDPKVTFDDFDGTATLIPGQDEDSLVAQYYLQYENGAQPSENLAHAVSMDRRAFRMRLRVENAPAADHLASFEAVRELLHTEFPHLVGDLEQVERGDARSTMSMTGRFYLFANLLEVFDKSLLKSVAVALIVITGLIGIVYKSVWLALLSVCTNLFPILFPLGILGLIGVPLDGPAVIVASLALGVCVDDTIHFLTKFRRERLAGATVESAITSTLQKVGPAMTWTTILLAVGFSFMTLSTFRPNMMIGYLGTVMVIIAWVCDAVLGPAILALVAARARRLGNREMQNR